MEDTKMSTTRDEVVLWVDFNDVNDRGQINGLPEYAKPGTNLSTGSKLVVGDGEGSTCVATVRASDLDFVYLDLDLSTFTAIELPVSCTL